MAIYTSLAQLVGRTPLLELRGAAAAWGAKARILGKLEFYNPSGSVKDRVALALLEKAEKDGLLRPGATIIEPTSGNTGIGLACLGISRGYPVIIVMPASASPERVRLLKAYGAQVVLTPANLGMQGAVDQARQLAAQIDGSFLPDQFTNTANPQAHFDTTGPEIWADTGGTTDIFVAGVGTGGTITGAGKYLRCQNPRIQIVAAEPAASPLLSRGLTGAHTLQGLGPNFIPQVLDTAVYDRVIPVTEEEAFAAARLVARKDGLFVGISSGAALHTALTLGAAPENQEKTIVVLLPDSAHRYWSTPLLG